LTSNIFGHIIFLEGGEVLDNNDVIFKKTICNLSECLNFYIKNIAYFDKDFQDSDKDLVILHDILNTLCLFKETAAGENAQQYTNSES